MNITEARKLMADEFGRCDEDTEAWQAFGELMTARRGQITLADDYQAVTYEIAAIADDDSDHAARLAEAVIIIAATDEATARKTAASWRAPITAIARPKQSAKWGDWWATEADGIAAVAASLADAYGIARR